MKIAVLTSGFLPVPAVQGGAVENLIDMYLAYNDHYKRHDITVYSASHKAVKHHPALHSDVNHYIYIDVSSITARFRKKLHRAICGVEYYHYSIEYYLEQAKKHIQERDYDLIVIENRPGYVIKLARDTPARIVCHLHNDVLNASTPRGADILNDLTRVVCVSDYLCSRVATVGLPDKCVTVHNGIDLHHFSPDAPTKLTRQSFLLHPDDFVLVFTGRVIPEKGIAELINAMKRLHNHPEVKLLVVGSSFYANVHQSNDFIKGLRKHARALSDRIFFTGYIPYDQMPSVLALADAAVLPSVWDEPLGLTCIEAMAMGLPVITTRKGGIPESVTSDCGILLPVDDSLSERLAEAIITLRNDPEACRRMGAAGRERAHLFSRENFCQHFFEAIENRL